MRTPDSESEKDQYVYSAFRVEHVIHLSLSIQFRYGYCMHA